MIIINFVILVKIYREIKGWFWCIDIGYVFVGKNNVLIILFIERINFMEIMCYMKVAVDINL